MERGLPIREDVATPSELRSLAKKEPRRRTAQRMLAIANALEGMRRADAARAAGIERQSRRDAVIRFNAEGLSGLVDRPHGHRREVLSEQAMLVHRVLVGPDPERGEPSSWTLPDLCRFIEERFGKTMCPQSMSRVVRRLGLSRQKARPPEARCPGRRALRQKGLRDTVAAAAETHPGKQVVLWFMDEARVGQKGRTGHRWWMRGERPPGLCDKRFASADIFAAVRPATGQDFALVLPRVCTEAMDRFLADFAAIVPADTQAVMVLDGAGWHDERSVTVPPHVTLVPLPPYSPELNPVERVWLYLRERYLSHRLHPDYEAVVNACCRAWNALTAEPGRIRSLCAYRYLDGVSS
jgi:transposase